MRTAVLAPVLLSATLAFAIAVVRGNHGIRTTRYEATRIRGSVFPKSLDDGHRATILARPPKRIASLTVTTDEILACIADPGRIVAVTPFADDPAIELTAGRAPPGAARVRGVDPEMLIALEPDLVFVSNFTLESGVEILSAASIPVVRLRDTRSYDDVASNVLLVADALGYVGRGQALVAEMRAKLGALRAKTAALPAPRVLYYSAVDYTAGTGTLVDEKIRLAGGRNVAAEAGLVGFESVALDLLIALDPDVIVVPQWSANENPTRTLTESAAWRDVSAVRNDRVYAVSAAALTSESPEGVAGVERLAHLFHPEVFRS